MKIEFRRRRLERPDGADETGWRRQRSLTRKDFVMRHLARMTAVLSVLLLGLLSASRAETVNVPFAFQARGISFPAGQYEVRAQSNHGFLALQSKEYPQKQIFWLLQPHDAIKDGGTVLSFDKTGAVPVLKSIQNQDWRTNEVWSSDKRGPALGQLRSPGND